ncbi:MAG: miniconductance mechanosensitive channel [Bacteroidia bacterium]|jgi:miniconductance mechanosensitive channel
MELGNPEHWMSDWLTSIGLAAELVPTVAFGLDICILILVALLADLIAKRVVLRAIESAVKRSSSTLDDIFFDKKVFDALAHLAPAVVIEIGAPVVFEAYPDFVAGLSKFIQLYTIVIVVWVMSSFLDALLELSHRNPYLKDKPMLSYIQLGKLLSYVMAGVMMFSILFSKSPMVVLSAFGAAGAVLIFVFKDTILGLVASIQISVNDTLRVGDWVSMEKFNADGDVIKITLNTIEVQNWDKTISTIPAYAFVSDSFKNWRGMSESGGRRIKRSLNISLSSVQFCNQNMLEQFKKFELLEDYIASRSEEISNYNSDLKVDKTYPLNGRHLTNLGIFRAYAERYLKANANIRTDMTCMVRQQAPTEVGIPLEIYCFTNTIEWLPYENIQSDIFDHLIATASLFELEIFQSPSGSDFGQLNSSN